MPNPFGQPQFHPDEPVQWGDQQMMKVKKVPKVGTPNKPPFFKLLQVGADVEMFLQDKNGKPVPCVGVVGGTKDHPIVLPGLPAGFMRQEDNVMYEFNIPPANSAEVFVESIGLALQGAEALLEPKGLKYNIVPSMRFEKEDLESEQAQHIGCEPDYNVWERSVNDIHEFPESHKNLRTSGGHVHVSFEVGNKAVKMPRDLEYMEAIIMAMDIFLGIPFISMEPPNERRELYGKAGAFRHKPYGVEYRVLSNYWISKPALTHYVFSQVQKVFEYLNKYSPDNVNSQLRQWHPQVVKAINNKNPASIDYITRNFKLQLVQNA